MKLKSLSIAALAACTIALSSAGGAQAGQQPPGLSNADLVQLAHGKRHFHSKGFGWSPWHHGCGWYFKKAKWTGADHWWKKYRRCIYGWH